MINKFVYKLIAWKLVCSVNLQIIVKIVLLLIFILSVKYINRMYFDGGLLDISFAETEDTKQTKLNDSGIVK